MSSTKTSRSSAPGFNSSSKVGFRRDSIVRQPTPGCRSPLSADAWWRWSGSRVGAAHRSGSVPWRRNSTVKRHRQVSSICPPGSPLLAVRVRISPVVHHQNGRTNPNSTSSSHTYVFLPSRAVRDPVALAFVWRMPDVRSDRASATRGGRESAQCLVPVHRSTRQ